MAPFWQNCYPLEHQMTNNIEDADLRRTSIRKPNAPQPPKILITELQSLRQTLLFGQSSKRNSPTITSRTTASFSSPHISNQRGNPCQDSNRQGCSQYLSDCSRSFHAYSFRLMFAIQVCYVVLFFSHVFLYPWTPQIDPKCFLSFTTVPVESTFFSYPFDPE